MKHNNNLSFINTEDTSKHGQGNNMLITEDFRINSKEKHWALTGILSGYFSLIRAASALLFSECSENKIIWSKQVFFPFLKNQTPNENKVRVQTKIMLLFERALCHLFHAYRYTRLIRYPSKQTQISEYTSNRGIDHDKIVQNSRTNNLKTQKPFLSQT